MNVGLGESERILPPGNDLEMSVVTLAEERGHAALLYNVGNPNAHGFDVVSLDTVTGVIHIWEAKDYHRTVELDNLTAFLNGMGQLTPKQAREHETDATHYLAKRQQKLWGDVLNAVPPGLVRERVEEMIKAGKVEYHLVGNRETRYSPKVQELFSDSKFHVENLSNWK